MSHLCAYLGPELPLAALLPLLAEGGEPAGGFGWGWYAANDRPALYRSPWPLATDPNLPHLAHCLESNLWLGSAEAAATRPPSFERLQPVEDGELLLLHDGDGTFTPALCAALFRHLTPRHEEAALTGGAAAIPFALLRQLLAEDDDLPLEGALEELVAAMERAAGGEPLALNLIASDGERLYVVRHALHRPCTPLYYTTDDDFFPDGQLVASAPPGGSSFWQLIPERHLLILDPEGPPELIGL